MRTACIANISGDTVFQRNEISHYFGALLLRGALTKFDNFQGQDDRHSFNAHVHVSLNLHVL